VDGQTIPIHLSGSCSGGRNRRALNLARIQKPALIKFDEPHSYLNPNAKCPVCGERVFFYQNENGGRVFFDDVGWPWPKHPCTDNAAALFNRTIYAAPHVSTSTRPDWTRLYTFLRLVSIHDSNGRTIFEFREVGRGLIKFLISLFKQTNKKLTFNTQKLRDEGITDSDFWSAPIFLIENVEIVSDRPILQFICPNKCKIIRIKMRVCE
jgi:hypothetical protein